MLYLYWRIAFGTARTAEAAAMRDLNAREWWLLAPIGAVVLWMGVYPESFMRPIRNDVGPCSSLAWSAAAPEGDATSDSRQADKPAAAQWQHDAADTADTHAPAAEGGALKNASVCPHPSGAILTLARLFDDGRGLPGPACRRKPSGIVALLIGATGAHVSRSFGVPAESSEDACRRTCSCALARL
jgi:hypothetical protein